jgi:integrase
MEGLTLKIIDKLKEELNYKSLRITSYDNAIIDYNRIKDMLKGESVRIISRAKLEVLINELPYRLSVKNKIICRLNLILKNAGRDFKITKKKIEEYEEISFIDEKQLNKLLKEVDYVSGNTKLIKDGIILMFYCGFREGELFGLSRNNFDKVEETYFIREQMQRDLSFTKPKNNKEREITVPSVAIDSLERWLSYPKQEKINYRLFLSRKVLEASRKTFKERKHQISNHDLRHSFAIWCLSKGLSLTEVSYLLGNTLQVCVRHYTGFSLQKEALKSIAKKLG